MMINFIVGSEFDFFPIYCDNPVGANDGAIGATCALIRVGGEGILVTFMIHFAGYRDDICRACSHTYFASFAALSIDYNNSSDFSHLDKKFKVLCSLISATKLLIKPEIRAINEFELLFN
jgi:hypothetical protein